MFLSAHAANECPAVNQSSVATFLSIFLLTIRQKCRIILSRLFHSVLAVMSFGQTQSLELPSVMGSDVVVGRLQRQPAKIHLLYGHSSVFMISLIVGSATNQPLAVIDGATRFNSYTMSKIATALGIPPPTLLHRTHVTRSFTAFQTETAIITKLPRFLQHMPCPLVIALGLLDAYYDEQVKPHECEQSLQRIMHTFRELTKNHIHILIADVEVTNPPPGKEKLFHLIHHAADIVLSLQPHEYGFQLKEERSKQQWDATTIPSLCLSTKIEKRGVSSEER